MTYSWTPDPNTTPQADTYTVTLHAHNSLTPTGFVWFFGITATLMVVPVLAFIGSVFLWMIMGFVGVAFMLTWLALKQSWKRGTVTETFEIQGEVARLIRTNPDGTAQTWEENPYWVQVKKVKTDGPVPNYITLSGRGRVVEIGAFLSQEERIALYDDLQRALRQINQIAP